MNNVMVHITLPRGIRGVSGTMLPKDTTFDVVSRLDPYYASINQVRLAGGTLLRKLSDITIACQVYSSGQEADLLNLHPPTGGSDLGRRFIGSRNQYVTALAARDLSLGVNELLGQKASHVLANFSVSRQGSGKGEGIAARLKELDDSIKFYEVVLRSGGRTVPGGRPTFVMAAKGVADWGERTPARTWLANGAGSNAKTGDYTNASGGRGKGFGLMVGPFSGGGSGSASGSFFSPPFINWYYGIFQGAAYPITVTTPPPLLP